MLKRLLGAVVDGLGHRAGGRLLDHAIDEATKPEPTEAELRAAARAAEAEAKKLERQAEEARAAREADVKRRDAEIDAELAALKKRVK